MYYLIVAIMLAVFWMLLSGYFTALLLSFGVLSVVLVVWLVARMDRADQERRNVYPTRRLIGYWGWLLWAVVKANIDVAKRIWHPDLPIDPNWSRLETKVSTPLEKTFYANSITLTPGTLTTNVNEDHFMVHALSQDGIRELREGEMERRILRLRI